MEDRPTRTVLLVDGSATMLYCHGILLKRLGYKVVTARTAESALQIAERLSPALVLTEVSFPGMSGAELIGHMKSSNSLKEIPVVVLTDEDNASTRAACLERGCAAYLLKPAEPSKLYRAIQAATEPFPRVNIRINTILKAAVGDGCAPDGAQRTDYTTTISEGGLYLRTLSPHPRDAHVPVRMFINEREIKATAVVLYTHTLEGGPFQEPGMGMKFIDISDEDRNFLRGFIRDHLTADILPGSSGR